MDSMDLERERGITIKAQSVALSYRARDGKAYRLNMIDTPGHVDFSYEVSRSLTACEGALLIVDASQGVQAQTVANCYTAAELDIEILPVLNKIDLPAADPERAIKEIEDIIGIDASHALRVSAKTGEGVSEILETLVTRLPPPKGGPVEDYEDRIQTLFRATAYGDDVDRPLIKSDGSYTYFASDIANHRNKFERGFGNLIDVFGADHGGYIKRTQAAVKAVIGGRATLDVKIVQLVRLMRRPCLIDQAGFLPRLANEPGMIYVRVGQPLPNDLLAV